MIIVISIFNTIKIYNKLLELHNENGPAIIANNGYKAWYHQNNRVIFNSHTCL